MPAKTSPRRGEIVRVRLDPVEGSEQGGIRPALILSPDIINDHSPIILIASITSKKTERVYPFEVLVIPPEGGLKHRSKILLMQLRAIDKRRVVGNYGYLTDQTIADVEAALKVAMGLTLT
jgi:mRNA interferase MazF